MSHRRLFKLAIVPGVIGALGVLGPAASTLLLVAALALACTPGSPLVELMLRVFGASAVTRRD